MLFARTRSRLSSALRCTLLPLLAFGVAGCGDDDEPITAPGNQAPAILISTNASFGIAQLTTFTFGAAVSEPDGNPVTITWTFTDGTTGRGANLWRTFPVAGTIEVTATATDHLGASGSNTVTVTVGSASGDWAGTIDLSSCDAGEKPMSAAMTQTGGAITGTLTFPEGLCSSTPITRPILQDDGTRMFASGAVRLHVALPGWPDASFQGQLATPGDQITGTFEGTDPLGLTFTLDRQ